MAKFRLTLSPNRAELIALAATALIVVGLPAAVLGYQFGLRPALAGVRTLDIVAAAPEAGGFMPDTFRVTAGETVRLRFSAPDVTHGLAIGPGLNLDFGQIDPGEVKEVDVTFDRPGRYTLYCNTWCSPNHWRMRATIEVFDSAQFNAPTLPAAPDPVLASLAARQVDIDVPHPASAVPAARPSAERGRAVVNQPGRDLPPELQQPEWRRSHSPAEAWAALLAQKISPADAWDAVAYLWLLEPDAARREVAAGLYAKNCAACHGQNGDGQGPGAANAAAQGVGHQADLHNSSPPTAFTDPQTMLGGSSDIYYAKLRRGGMGTGMPAFGPLFTPEESQLMADYLWTFVFDPE
jgi:plastocyanin/mono/diheme cytochrome c family protein